MSIVAAYKYRAGERAEAVDLADPLCAQVGDDEFVWIGVTDPTHEELRLLGEQ